MLVLAADGSSSGVEIDVAGKTLSASSEVVSAIAGTAERMWSRTLDWAERSPVEFALVIILLMFIVVQHRKAKVTSTAMIIEYDLRREEIRNQEPPLPLPLPSEPRE